MNNPETRCINIVDSSDENILIIFSTPVYAKSSAWQCTTSFKILKKYQNFSIATEPQQRMFGE